MFPRPKYGVFDPTALGDKEYVGRKILCQVGEEVSFGDVGYLDPTSSKYIKSSSDTLNSLYFPVLFLEAKSSNEQCIVLRGGWIKNSAWNWNVGDILWVDSSGSLTATKPSGGSWAKAVAYAYTSQIIDFNPGNCEATT